MCAAETKETLKRKKKRMEQARSGKKNITRTKKCFIVTYLRILGKKVEKTKHAVSVDRTRDLQIFSLTLSQLSYPR